MEFIHTRLDRAKVLSGLRRGTWKSDSLSLLRDTGEKLVRATTDKASKKQHPARGDLFSRFLYRGLWACGNRKKIFGWISPDLFILPLQSSSSGSIWKTALESCICLDVLLCSLLGHCAIDATAQIYPKEEPQGGGMKSCDLNEGTTRLSNSGCKFGHC